MKINVAHVNIQGLSCLICDADHQSRTQTGRNALLGQLTAEARAQNLRVDKSALAFRENGQLMFFGTPDLVRFLSNNGLPRWTHVLTL